MKTKSQLLDANILKDSLEYPWMFGMLVDRYQAAFIRKAIYILHSHDIAEDAVQDTFLKIYKYADKFLERRDASFNSWAYKILVNTCYTHASKKALDSNRVRAMDFVDLDLLSNTDTLSDKEQASFVQSVLFRLPRNLSRLLLLYFFENKSYEEIATMENLSLSAVRSGLYRAKRQFKDMALKMA